MIYNVFWLFNICFNFASNSNGIIDVRKIIYFRVFFSKDFICRLIKEKKLLVRLEILF